MWRRRSENSLSLLLLFCIFTALHAYRITEDARWLQSPATAITDSNQARWNLSEKPNLNDTTSNFIFETANSLVQHWPNTRYRNGHTLVPVTIPTGTLLYHGTTKPEIPEVPDWLATDPEHSYLFCGLRYLPYSETNRTTETGCWHLTFVTTRPLKLLYFDGSSAAKMPDGPLDSQDLLTWGRVREDLVRKERERIDKLCKWRKDFNLDGFVRMEMDFEVMLCDLTMGLDLVTSLMIHIPQRPKAPSPKLPTHRVRALEAGSWSNRFPGDNRIKVDYSRLISFYDKTSFPNLHLQRVGQERWYHRLNGTNNAELERLLLRLKEAFTEEERERVIDWKTLLHVMTDRYANTLESLQYLLENATTSSEADQEAGLWKAHRFVSSVLAHHILYDSVPPDNSIRNDHNWAVPVFKYCASTHTQYLETLTNLTASEKLLLNAIQEVSKEICRVLVLIWAEGEELSTKPRGPEYPVKGIRDYVEASRRNLLIHWKSTVSDLMSWLDWSVWVRCRPACSYAEMCYLPTWPYFLHYGFEDEEDWKRPQPICIPRLELDDL